ncbi:MAG: FtsB family cell division protein [Anaerovoracaceae bacterium]
MIKRRKNRKFNNDQIIDIESAREERRKRRKNKQQSEEKPGEGITHRRATKIRRHKAIYSAVFLILIVIIGLSVFNLISLKLEEATAGSELKALKKEKKVLEEELKHVDSNDYIEQQARQELNMILPGETLYILEKEEKKIAED